MDSPTQALLYLDKQRRSGSKAWFNKCEMLCRSSYGLPAHYSSAELHAKAVPARFKHGHQKPSKGDLAFFLNGGYGHIVVCTGNGWGCYTNDYKGRGTVAKISDLRVLAGWCNAKSWFIADAWWSSKNFIETHDPQIVPPMPKPPEPKPPVPNPVPPVVIKKDDEDMAFIFKTHADADKTGAAGGGAHYLVFDGRAVQMDKNYDPGNLSVVASPSEANDEAFYASLEGKRYKLNTK